MGWHRIYWRCLDGGQAFYASLKTVAKLGAGQILYWESDYIDVPGRAEFGTVIVKRFS